MRSVHWDTRASPAALLDALSCRRPGFAGWSCVGPGWAGRRQTVGLCQALCGLNFALPMTRLSVDLSDQREVIRRLARQGCPVHGNPYETLARPHPDPVE